MNATMKKILIGVALLVVVTVGVIVYVKLSEPDYSKVPYPNVTSAMASFSISATMSLTAAKGYFPCLS